MVKRSAKNDRRRWLEDLVQTGEWSQIRKCRKGFAPKPSKLKNMQGEVVESTQRADTMAEYFERVQWAVRPMTDIPTARACLGEVLNVNLGPVTSEEISTAAGHLRKNRATGDDEIPGEFWRAIATEGTAGANWLTAFCNTCWRGKQVPTKWHLARVAAIFKKGQDDECTNYRPISLLCVAYKLFACILLWRLKEAGAEQRIWATQYGFKSRHSTADALFLARRMIEETWDKRDGRLMLLALDWAKAFDSVSPDALCESLRRFGIPADFIQMVRAVYTDRRFYVQESTGKSCMRDQHFGISQGCPLSPFLFIIMMTLLMHDAEERLGETFGPTQVPYLVTRTLLYADDTLVLEGDERIVKTYMDSIAAIGKEYGLAFNWEKLELLRVRHEGYVSLRSGSNVKEKESMVYLGGLLAADGRMGSELARRLGAAAADFTHLKVLWQHANVSRAFKIQVYEACVVQKLMYCLHTGCFSKAQLRKLDGFHARCLRQILSIPHAKYFRISNAKVLATARAVPLSSILLERQLRLFGDVFRKRAGDPLRAAVFDDGSASLRQTPGARRQGHPRQNWAICVRKHALAAAGGEGHLQAVMRDKVRWDGAVRHYCSRASASESATAFGVGAGVLQSQACG